MKLEYIRFLEDIKMLQHLFRARTNEIFHAALLTVWSTGSVFPFSARTFEKENSDAGKVQAVIQGD